MNKIISACGIIVKNSISRSVFIDRFKKEKDIRAELKEEHGVHQFTPFRGNDVFSVYDDVKASGTYVKDSMAAEREKNDKKFKQKRREWAIAANKRVAKRDAFAKEQRAKEESAKRKISV